MQEQYPLAELSDIEWRLSQRLKDRDFRREFFRAELEDAVPEAYKMLRERRELTQAELAEMVGTKQSGISRFEKSNDAAWQFDFLLRMAEAMDARLRLIVEAGEDVLGEYEEPIEGVSSALTDFASKSLEQQQRPSALSELGNLNGTREHRGEPSSLSRLPKIDEGSILRAGHAQRGGRALQLSALPGASAAGNI